jgi:hypothetical protein
MSFLFNRERRTRQRSLRAVKITLQNDHRGADTLLQ